MSIEIKFIATDKTDLASQMRAYLANDGECELVRGLPSLPPYKEPVTYITNPVTDTMRPRPGDKCIIREEPICYQEAVDGATVINRDHDYSPLFADMTKAGIRRRIADYLGQGMDAKAIQKALVTEWSTELSLAAIGGIMGGIRTQQRKQEAHDKAVDEKILSMKSCDPLLIADTINRELGGNWTEEKVARRLKELMSNE